MTSILNSEGNALKSPRTLKGMRLGGGEGRKLKHEVGFNDGGHLLHYYQRY